MHACFPVTRATAEDLQRFVSHEVDLVRREYFFEAYRRAPVVTRAALLASCRRFSTLSR